MKKEEDKNKDVLIEILEAMEERNQRYKSREESREKIKNDLLDQLENNNAYGSHYIDLVNDYMALWDIKNELIYDIDKKGVSVLYQNGKNQWGYKKNDSIAELNKTNGQMLKILTDLGLKTSDIKVVDDDEEM